MSQNGQSLRTAIAVRTKPFLLVPKTSIRDFSSSDADTSTNSALAPGAELNPRAMADPIRRGAPGRGPVARHTLLRPDFVPAVTT
jgi:hypothetical protein